MTGLLEANMMDFRNKNLWLMQGDCLERMKEIPDGSVDMILADPPYGTTACKWDSIIPLEPMWEQLKRVIKPYGAIVLFGQEPFSSYLRLSNVRQFKYDFYWKKSRPSGFVNAKLKPLKDIEVISVFSSGTTANKSNKNMPYIPQGLVEVNKQWTRPKTYGTGEGVNPTRKSHNLSRNIKYENYPRQVLEYSQHNVGQVHPTQKPVALMEHLIKTYTNEGETVLDFTAGSFTTGVACVNLNRNFVGIELDKGYFDIGVNRITGRAMTGLLETIQRRLARLEFIMLTAEQMSLETGGDIDTKLIRFAAKKSIEWNRKRVAMGLPEYW